MIGSINFLSLADVLLSFNCFPSNSNPFLLKKKFKCFPVYYPVGNGIFNMDKAVEDILWIKKNN